MSYVIYHTETTRIFKENIKTERAAKAQLTKAANFGEIEDRADYAIADTSTFHNSIEKMIERKNFMTGEKFMERINTPYYCSPSSETFWSM